MKKFLSLTLVFSFIIFGIFGILKPIYDSVDFPTNMYVTSQDIASANSNSNFSPFVKFSLSDNLAVNSEKVSETTMKIKLFGWLPIKNVKVKLLNDVDVLVGGNTVGFHLNSEGVVVVGSNPVFTAQGNLEPVKKFNIQTGDTIKKINGEEIKSIEDISRILNAKNQKQDTVEIEIIRDNELMILNVQPALDLFTKKYRLGLWVKNNTSGVGTLTYIKKSDNRFGAVGHPISASDMGDNFKVASGEVYLCNYLGIKKGTKDNPGEIKTSIKLSDDTIGNADTNCDYGVYGNIFNTNKLDTTRSATLGGRLSVKMGDAKIYCDIDGEGVKGYDIKIVKTSHQNQANEKSIMFKVTDKELIEKTGGIIQGMSGSPIIQDGKLVGAVTHVFLNDPTKAFGVYIDWMIDN